MIHIESIGEDATRQPVLDGISRQLALGIERPSLEQELSYLEQFSDDMIRKLG
jgi:GAF domain-containing protein